MGAVDRGRSFPASDPPSSKAGGPPKPTTGTPAAPSAPAAPVTMADGTEFELDHGAVVIAAITSCTNTSNPSVMLGAGLLARKAVEAA